MKKTIIIITALVGTSFLFSSCSKDYECVCRINGIGPETRYSVRAKTKNSAEDECNQKATTLGITFECKIE